MGEALCGPLGCAISWPVREPPGCGPVMFSHDIPCSGDRTASLLLGPGERAPLGRPDLRFCLGPHVF